MPQATASDLREQQDLERSIYQEVPPLREQTFSREKQPLDGKRIEYARKLWTSQDHLLMARDRQIEENIRMLAGQHWSVWSPVFGRFVDISELMEDEDDAWRQRPVVNRLLIWFMLTKARLTENPPILSFLPSTGDRFDAQLAQVSDPIFKTLWHDADMLEVHDRMVSWLVPSGASYLKTRVDPNIGDLIEWTGEALLDVPGADGGPRIGSQGGAEQVLAEGVPYNFDEEGQVVPQARVTEDGDGWEPTGKAFEEHEGGIRVDVLSPPQVRGQWGPAPWHEKRWHIHKSYLTPEEVWDTYQVECEPDFHGAEADRVGELRRLLFGTGFYGAASHQEHGVSGVSMGADEYCEVLELWHAPSNLEGMQERQDAAGGRLLAVTRNKVLRDGQRPAKFEHTSPIREFGFVDLPGRPTGTSPQEALNPIQRSYNRGWAQIMEHRNLVANPIGIVDTRGGLTEGQVTNEPGQLYYMARDPNSRAAPIEYVQPPRLNEDVWRSQSLLLREFQDIAHIEGAEGRPPTTDPSGELVKELRFNADRYIGPTARQMVTEYGRLAEDWMAILPTIWDREKAISYAGDDQVTRTVTVTPELFERGNIHVRPDLESMLPEGRGERQQRALRFYEMGLFGPPGSSEAVRKFYDVGRFPHLDRVLKPGGVDRVTAEQNNGRLVRGTPARQVPIYEWYDFEVHLSVTEEFMKSPEFLKLDLEVKQEFVNHRQRLLMAERASMEKQLARRAEMAVEAGRTRTGVQAELADASLQAEDMLAQAASGRGQHVPGSRESVQGAPGNQSISTRPRGR